MFSKPLYRQSWKANWIHWLSVTIVSSFILTIIMIVAGGDGVSSLTTAFKETFVKEELESNFKNIALNYYHVSHEPLNYLDEKILDHYVDEIIENPHIVPTNAMKTRAYNAAFQDYQVVLKQEIYVIDETLTEDDIGYNELLAAGLMSVNNGNIFNFIFEQYEPGSSPASYDTQTLFNSISQDDLEFIWNNNGAPEDVYDVLYSLERHTYRYQRARHAATIFFSGNMNSDEARAKIYELLIEVNVTKEQYDAFGFNYEGLKSISSDAIINYQSRFDYEVSKLDVSAPNYEEEVMLIKKRLREDITSTVISSLPKALGDSMTEMQDYDVYAVTVGGMYFKIVGLLIAVIYVIMVGVNLIAGQVDSGAMAYILSTGTKRESVAITQLIFFITSTFLLYVVTSIVSTIVFVIASPPLTNVTVWNLLLINFGAFITTMTLGSIVFLTSSIFNRSRQAMGIGGGFSILTVSFTILGMFATNVTPSLMRMEPLSIFNKVSLISLFDVQSIVEGSPTWIWKLIILVVISLVCYLVGINVFKRKDLPL